MSDEIHVIGQPNPQVLRVLLDSVLNWLAEQPVQPGQPVEVVAAVEIDELVSA